MTKKVLRSEIHGITNFEEIVETYARDLRDWRRQDAMAREGKADPYPHPFATDLVAACLGQPSLVPDYVIEEDVPPPPSPLRLRKDALLHQVALAANNAVSRALPPPGKQALASILYNEAIVKEQKTQADQRLIREHEERLARVSAIQRVAATQQAAIEDLTEDNISEWRLEPAE